MTMTPNGRGSRRVKLFRPEIAEQILDAIEEGRSVRSICEEIGFHKSIFHGWVVDDVEGLASRYTRAKAIGNETIVERIAEIAAGEHRTAPDDHVAVGRDRLHVDTLKWHAAKVAPTKYGDSSTLQIKDVNDTITIVPRTKEDIAAARAAFLAKHGKQ
jgi:hypothetical protein